MIEIREARLEDATQLAAIGSCVWVDTYATEGMKASIAQFVLTEFTNQTLINTITSKTVSVAVSSGHIVGYSVVCSETAELEVLYVLPRFQRKRIGEQLLRVAKNSGDSIWLSCWERNERAITFYKLHGFIEVGEAYFDLDGERHRNIVLES